MCMHRLLEDRSGVVVQGLEEVIVRSATEIYQVRSLVLPAYTSAHSMPAQHL